MKKILVLIINSQIYPSNISVPIIRKTWAKDTPDSVQFMFVEDTADKTYLKKDRLKISTAFKKASDDPVSYRMKYAFLWILENLEFDVLYRATTTSYIDLCKLVDYVNGLNLINLYSGPPTLYPPKIPNPAFQVTNQEDKDLNYANGSGYFLSRDVIEIIKDNIEDLSLSHYDDVSLGYLMGKLGIKQQNSYQKNLQFFPSGKDFESEYFHYRFKLGKYSELKLPRFLEIFIIISFHLFKKTKNNSYLYSIFVKLIINLLRFVFYGFKYLNIFYEKLFMLNKK